MYWLLRVVVALALSTSAASATVYEIPFSGWSVSGFGSYVGQTFKVPPGEDNLDKLVVYLGDATADNFSFHLLITEFTGTTYTDFHPTTVLFESGPITVGNSLTPVAPIEIDLGAFPLTAGSEYAWILDHVVVGSLQGESVSVGLANAAILGEPDIYPNGFGFYLPPSPFFPSGTREENFASTWFVSNPAASPFDYAFTAITREENVPAVPVPPTLILFCSALSGLGLLGKWTRKGADIRRKARPLTFGIGSGIRISATA